MAKVNIEGWKYYNHAMIPSTAPHIVPDLTEINNGNVWKIPGVLLARYTTDWNYNKETSWWYIVKDEPFDISKLKAKRRYEINKGKKNFIVKEIDPKLYADDLFEIAYQAYKTYPKYYRPDLSKEQFCRNIDTWNFYKVYGAFYKEDNKLSGYACLKKDGKYIDFCVMKSIPNMEKHGLNAAMVDKILLDHEDFLTNYGYICDGSRSVFHETAFQDYLEKYFEFRKVYCLLHIQYNPKYKIIIQVAYYFRKIFLSIDNIRLNKVKALLKMEEINRNCKRNGSNE